MKRCSTKGAADAGQAGALIGIAQQRIDRGRQRHDVARRDQSSRSAVGQDLADPGDVAPDHRRLRGQCLEQDERQPLGDRRKDHQIGGLDERRYVRPHPEETDALVDPEVVRQLS